MLTINIIIKKSKWKPFLSIKFYWLSDPQLLAKSKPVVSSHEPPSSLTIVHVLWTATVIVFPSLISPSTKIWLEESGIELCLLKLLTNFEAGSCSLNITLTFSSFNSFKTFDMFWGLRLDEWPKKSNKLIVSKPNASP